MSPVQLQIIIPNPSGYTLNTIIGSPRTCTPYDVKVAGDNLEISLGDEKGPPQAEAGGSRRYRGYVDFVRYLLLEFFALAHSTGLYNRQKNLWESLAKVTNVKVNPLTQGVFTKTELPIIDFYCLDAKSRVLLFATLCEPHADWREEKKCRAVLSDFLRRAEKVQRKDPPVFAGLFLSFPRSFPASVLKEVEHMTGARDPIGRYESIAPALGVPINLIESSAGTAAKQADEIAQTDNPDKTELMADEEGASLPQMSGTGGDYGAGSEEGSSEIARVRYKFELIHPDIITEKRGRK